jgi:transposase
VIGHQPLELFTGVLGDHLPLYRQSQIFARHGVEIDRSTLANWVGGACWWLEPLQARLAAHVFGSTKLFADDTPIPVLDPGRGRTKSRSTKLLSPMSRL